jgi:hypothetical protein
MSIKLDCLFFVPKIKMQTFLFFSFIQNFVLSLFIPSSLFCNKYHNKKKQQTNDHITHNASSRLLYKYIEEEQKLRK